MSIIDLGDVTDSSIEVAVSREPQNKPPLRKSLNPDALAEIYSDSNYRKLNFEQLEVR